MKIDQKQKYSPRLSLYQTKRAPKLTQLKYVWLIMISMIEMMINNDDVEDDDDSNDAEDDDGSVDKDSGVDNMMTIMSIPKMMMMMMLLAVPENTLRQRRFYQFCRRDFWSHKIQPISCGKSQRQQFLTKILSTYEEKLSLRPVAGTSSPCYMSPRVCRPLPVLSQRLVAQNQTGSH